MGPACRDDDSYSCCVALRRFLAEGWRQEVEEQRMAYVVDAEGGFEVIDGLGQGAGELHAGVEEERLDWRVVLGFPVSRVRPDLGQVAEVEREENGVGLAQRLVDGVCGVVFVRSRGYDDQGVGALLGNLECRVVLT